MNKFDLSFFRSFLCFLYNRKMNSNFSSPTLITFVLSREHGIAAGVAISSWLVLQYMGVDVMKARKRYNVEYPKLYANDSDPQGKLFNCIQRGHQHTLEVYPEFLLMLGLGSIKYPLISSIGGVIWLLGRIVFFKGYSTGYPEKRRYGSFGNIGLYTMMGCAIKSIYDLIRA
jgi:glutathione S-transferase